MHVFSQAGGMHVLPKRSWNVTGTCVQRAFVFYLGLCMFSCNITGTCSKPNGPNVAFLNARIMLYFSGFDDTYLVINILKLH